MPDDIVLAIDVGGTKSAAALVRRDGAVLPHAAGRPVWSAVHCR